MSACSGTAAAEGRLQTHGRLAAGRRHGGQRPVRRDRLGCPRGGGAAPLLWLFFLHCPLHAAVTATPCSAGQQPVSNQSASPPPTPPRQLQILDWAYRGRWGGCDIVAYTVARFCVGQGAAEGSEWALAPASQPCMRARLASLPASAPPACPPPASFLALPPLPSQPHFRRPAHARPRCPRPPPPCPQPGAAASCCGPTTPSAASRCA